MDFKDIFLKLDKISDDVSELRIDSAKSVVILDRNTRDIQEHIKRTDLLEAKVDLHKAELDKSKNTWKGAVWAATAIFGAITTLGQIFARLLFK